MKLSDFPAARDARHWTALSQDQTAQYEVMGLRTKIHHAIERGESRLVLQTELRPRTAAYLKELGYGVDIMTSGKPFTVVTW